jgi:hypothetical protein
MVKDIVRMCGELLKRTESKSSSQASHSLSPPCLP